MAHSPSNSFTDVRNNPCADGDIFLSLSQVIINRPRLGANLEVFPCERIAISKQDNSRLTEGRYPDNIKLSWYLTEKLSQRKK
jgi:hypothetical protein